MDITLSCSLDTLKAHRTNWPYPVINLENPLYPGYLDGDIRPDLEYLRLETHLRLVLDGPYIDLNLGSPEPKARRLAQEKVLAALDFAQQCQAEEVVFLSTFLPFIGLPFYERGWIEESIRSWKMILQQPGDLPISLCNTFEYDPANLLEVVAAIGQSRFGLALDVGHCLLWGRLDTVAWYRRIRECCRVVYLHSNTGRADEHTSIQAGLFAEQGLAQSLGVELRRDSIVILKYFDPQNAETDIEYLQTAWSKNRQLL